MRRIAVENITTDEALTGTQDRHNLKNTEQGQGQGQGQDATDLLELNLNKLAVSESVLKRATNKVSATPRLTDTIQQTQTVD